MSTHGCIILRSHRLTILILTSERTLPAQPIKFLITAPLGLSFHTQNQKKNQLASRESAVGVVSRVQRLQRVEGFSDWVVHVRCKGFFGQFWFMQDWDDLHELRTVGTPLLPRGGGRGAYPSCASGGNKEAADGVVMLFLEAGTAGTEGPALGL